jgi:hypothetical protein
VLLGKLTKTRIDAAGHRSSLVLHSHHSHSELRKITGLGHDVKPQPHRSVWLPAAERRRRKRQHVPQAQQQQQQTLTPLLPESCQEHSTSHQDVTDRRSSAVGRPYYFDPTTQEARWERPYNFASEEHCLGLPEIGAQAEVQGTSAEKHANVLDATVAPELAPVVSGTAEAVDEVTTVHPQRGPQLVRSKRRQQSLDEQFPHHAARCVACASDVASFHTYYTSLTTHYTQLVCQI